MNRWGMCGFGGRASIAKTKVIASLHKSTTPASIPYTDCFLVISETASQRVHKERVTTEMACFVHSLGTLLPNHR